MKKNKGFTLIEIMAVVIVLAIIALIVTPLVTGTLKSSKEDLYETQLENIKSASKSYMVNLDLEDKKTITLTLADLKKEGLVDKEIKNPKTGKQFNNCIMIEVTRSGNIYDYQVYEDVESDNCSITATTMLLIGSVNYQTQKGKPYVEPGVILLDDRGVELSLNEVKVDIKNGATNIEYYEFVNNTTKYIDTTTETQYEITYKYINNNNNETLSKTRTVSVEDYSNLQCMIVADGETNKNNEWVTKNRIARIISINSEIDSKNLQYSLSTTPAKKYGTNTKIDVGSDGKITLYGYVKDPTTGNEGACTNTIQFEAAKPTCNVSLSGTKMATGWYINNVTATLHENISASQITGRDITLNSTPSYNGKTSLIVSDNGEKNIYGYIKDEALQENSCVSSVKIDKTTSVSAVITGTIEGTTTTYTSGTPVNKNVVLTANVNPATTTSGYNYQWYKDNVAISGATSATYKATTSGTYKLSVTTGSGISASSNSIVVVIDKTLPTIAYNPTGGGFNTTKTVTITATDANFDYMNVSIYKGNTEISRTTGIKTSTYQVALDSEGTWTVYTQAYDKAGNRQNQSPQNSYGWYFQTYTIDTTKPTVSYSIPGGSYNSTKTVTVTASDKNFKYMNIHVYKGNTVVSQKNNITTNTYQVALDSNGTWTIYTQAYDVYGNKQSQSPENSYGWYFQTYTIDTVKPTCSIGVQGTMGQNNWYVSDVTATLNPVNATYKGMTTSTTANYNNATSQTYSTSQTVYGYVASSTKLNTNKCSSTFKVDKHAPTISNFTATTVETTTNETSTKDAYGYSISASVTNTTTNFTVVATDNTGGSGIATYSLYKLSIYNYNNYETLLGTNKTGVFSANVGDLATTGYKVVVTDYAGNTSEKTIEEKCSLVSTSECINSSKTHTYSCAISKREWTVTSYCVVPTNQITPPSQSSGGSSSSSSSNNNDLLVHHDTVNGNCMYVSNPGPNQTSYTTSC